jgi:hypothetical protein
MSACVPVVEERGEISKLTEAGWSGDYVLLIICSGSCSVIFMLKSQYDSGRYGTQGLKHKPEASHLLCVMIAFGSRIARRKALALTTG